MAKKKENGTKFDPNAPVRVSSRLYDLDKCRWKMSTHGYRMLFALAQGLRDGDLFHEVSFRKEELFRYLGLTTTNRRHEVLADTLKEVRQSGLDTVSVNPKTGKRTWIGMSWITDYQFSEDAGAVNIRMNETAVPYLSELKQYATIQPKTYLRLSTDYQNWLYPLLKMRCGLGRWEMSIDNIVESLNLLEIDSYNKLKCKNAIMNILRNVIGIEASQAFKDEQKAAKAEKRASKPVAWDYVKNKEGKPSGTLWTIASETDIQVWAYPIKEGRSYSKVVFLIKEKIACMSAAHKEKLYQAAVHSAELDMGGSTYRKPVRMVEEPELIQLEGTIGVELCKNPLEEAMSLTVDHAFYETEYLIRAAGEAGLSLEQYAKAGRFVKHPNGKWFRR